MGRELWSISSVLRVKDLKLHLFPVQLQQPYLLCVQHAVIRPSAQQSSYTTTRSLHHICVDLSIECLHCKQKQHKHQASTFVSVSLQSGDSERRSDVLLGLFSQSVTSRRDTTLFLNKPFFCDRRLRLWFTSVSHHSSTHPVFTAVSRGRAGVTT